MLVHPGAWFKTSEEFRTMEMVAEEWRDIPGFNGYQASSLGRVRSLDAIVRTARNPNMTRRRKGSVLKPIPHRGYLVVKLGGPNRARGVHQAVALAFHGVPAEGLVVDHIDCNKLNNVPNNLEYVSNSENVRRAHRSGLMPVSRNKDLSTCDT
jgi:hypothetical protein